MHQTLLDDDAYYRLYHFHPTRFVERIVNAVLTPHTHKERVFFLRAPVGFGRTYIVRSSLHHINASYTRPRCYYIPLDYTAYQVSNQPFAEYLNSVLATNAPSAYTQWVCQLIERSESFSHLISTTLSMATIPQIGFSLDVPIPALLRWFRNTQGHAWPALKQCEELRRFLQSYRRTARLVLHVRDGSSLPLPVLYDLMKASASSPNTWLVVSLNENETSSHDGPINKSLVADLPCAVLTREELTSSVKERLRPNALPASIYDALFAYSHGHPRYIAAKLIDLVTRGLIDNVDGTWRLENEGATILDLASTFEAELVEPFETATRNLRSTRPELTCLAHDALLLCAVCKQAPLEIICAFLSEGSKTGEDELIDAIDDIFRTDTDDSIFRYSFQHPGFPQYAIYSFSNPLIADVIVRRANPDIVRRLAREFLEYLKPIKLPRTRDVQMLFRVLSNIADAEGAPLDMVGDVDWWIADARCESIRDYVRRALLANQVTAEALLEEVSRRRSLPPLFRLGVLDGLVCGRRRLGDMNERVGVPLSRSLQHMQETARALLELDRNHEAYELIREALTHCRSDSTSKAVLYYFAGRANHSISAPSIRKKGILWYRLAIKKMECAEGVNSLSVANLLMSLLNLLEHDNAIDEAARCLIRAADIHHQHQRNFLFVCTEAALDKARELDHIGVLRSR